MDNDRSTFIHSNIRCLTLIERRLDAAGAEESADELLPHPPHWTHND